MKIQLFFLFLGWVLGTISPAIAERIQRIFRKREIKDAIYLEMRDLKVKLASIIIYGEIEKGGLTKDLLRWFDEITSDATEFCDELTRDPRWKSFLELDENVIRALSRAMLVSAGGRTSTYKRYALPYLESRIADLNLFPSDFQRKIARIRGTLSAINQEMDIHWFYFQKTFDGLSDSNHKIICTNQKGSEAFITQLCRRNIRDIQTLLQL